MRQHDNLRAPLRKIVQRRNEPLDPGRVADLTLGQGHVEISPDNDPQAIHIDLIDTFVASIGNDRRHPCRPMLFGS